MNPAPDKPAKTPEDLLGAALRREAQQIPDAVSQQLKDRIAFAVRSAPPHQDRRQPWAPLLALAGAAAVVIAFILPAAPVPEEVPAIVEQQIMVTEPVPDLTLLAHLDPAMAMKQEMALLRDDARQFASFLKDCLPHLP